MVSFATVQAYILVAIHVHDTMFKNQLHVRYLLSGTSIQYNPLVSYVSMQFEALTEVELEQKEELL